MKRNKTYIVMLLGILSLAALQSCKIMKPYETPKVETEGLFRDVQGNDTTTIASVPWRDYFTDPKLQALIEEGLNNNYDMKIALQRIEEAKTNLSSAKKAWLPSLGIGGTVTHNTTSSKGSDGSVNYLSNNSNLYAFGLAYVWELDLWGKMSHQTKSKFAQFLNSQESRNLVQSNIVAGIANYYYTLLALDKQLKITNETIGLLQETVKTMESLKEAGQTNAASIEQTKSTLYSAQVSIPELKMSIFQTENALNLLLGKPAGVVDRGELDGQTVPEELKAGVPLQLLSYRPDVRSAELGFRSAFELTNVARASFYPTVSITQGSLFGYGAAKLEDLFKPANLLFRVLGQVVQPIFAQGQLSSGLNVAKAEQEIALQTYRKTVLEAGTEVSNVLYTFNTSKEKNELRKEQISSLQNSVEYTQLLLKAGEANYLEVITSESNLLAAKLSQVSDKLEQLQASVNLYKALGGGTK